ncbi:MAG: hypothetical protein AAFU49_22110 [Pseudomonadota bacterium]
MFRQIFAEQRFGLRRFLEQRAVELAAKGVAARARIGQSLDALADQGDVGRGQVHLGLRRFCAVS